MEDKPRYSRISDLLNLILLMASKLHGVTLTDIQEEFKVSRRTAERMRDAVLAILPSVDEIETNDRQKHWGFANYSVNSLVSFDDGEIITLEKIKNNFDNVTNNEIGKIVTKLKVLKTKDKNVFDNLELILQSEGMAIRQTPTHKINPENISLVREAIKKQKRIKADYHDKNRVLSPLGVVYGEKVYLAAREKDKTDPRYYRFHELKNIEITDEDFDFEGFNLKKFCEKSFGIYLGEIFKVELEFDKSVKNDVLNFNFHPTQKVKELDNGNVSVKFNASGELHIIWHLFKWGNNVKILKPKKLKDKYKEYLENVLKGLS